MALIPHSLCATYLPAQMAPCWHAPAWQGVAEDGCKEALLPLCRMCARAWAAGRFLCGGVCRAVPLCSTVPAAETARAADM